MHAHALSYWRIDLTEYFSKTKSRVGFFFIVSHITSANCTLQRNHRVFEIKFSHTIFSSLYVSEITSMSFAFAISRGSVFARIGVEMRSSGSTPVWKSSELISRNLNVFMKFLFLPVLSPNVWTWNPCWPGASPEISPLTETGPSPWNDELKYDKSLYELLIFRQGNCNLTKTGSPIRWLEIRLK